MRRSATRAGLIVLLALATCAVSYAQSDSIVWQYRYSGPGNSDDQPLASFVDDTGNVYVVGWTERDSTGLDVLVLKLDSLGSQIWVRTYDYGRRKNDVAMDAARDPSGNVYISASVVDANGDRLCLLKYNPSGELVWTRSYGEANLDYGASGVVVDGDQNVYVVGVTESSTHPTVRVLKYAANGDLVWMKSYSASASYEHIWSARFHPLANGGVYLALTAEHSQRRDDWLIVKLSPQGAVRWERVYKESGSSFERLSSSQVDGKANIYVTGEVVSSVRETEDFCTMKIDSSGNVLWTREYNGPENLQDVGLHLLLDQNRVYVAGRSVFVDLGGYRVATLVKYDTMGTELWVSRYAAADTDYVLGYEDVSPQPPFCSMTSDGTGSVYLTGSAVALADTSGCYAVTIKYDAQGDLQWSRRLSDAQSNMLGATLALDSRGHLYTIGVAGHGGQCDIFVVKYKGR